MIPGKFNVVCPQGATYSEHLTYLVDDVPIDLTNYSAKMQIRESYDSTYATVSLDSTSGIVLGGAEGTIIISISASDTAKIFPKTYVFDLELKTGDAVIRLIEGQFIVTPEVTR